MGENVYIRDLIDFDVTMSTSRGKSKLEYKFQDKENSEDIFSFGSALEDFISVVFVPDRNIVKMENPIITMEEYIRLEGEKARRHAIVFNDTLTSEATLSCEPTVSSLNNDEIDFRISFDESDDEDCT
ncbi:hypothetical protein Tco_0691270, partial [Tanacetum coccineum]